MRPPTPFLLALLLLFTSGCTHTFVVESNPVTGTELVEDENGRMRLVTYVTNEEYERMTPEERRRGNYAIGVSSSVKLKKKSKKAPVYTPPEPELPPRSPAQSGS